MHCCIVRTHGSSFQARLSAPALRRWSLPWLSPKEKLHYASLSSGKLRHTYLAARALSRLSLSEYTGVGPAEWCFAEGKYGKPEISAPLAFTSLRFNIAHTQGLVVCILSRAGEVGIDAENVVRLVDIEAIARESFPPQESQKLENRPKGERRDRFFKLWVLKEAALKGMGLGLGGDDEHFMIALDESEHPLPVPGWEFSLKRLSKRYIVATAIHPEGGTRCIPVHWFNGRDLFKAGVTVADTQL